MSKSPSGLNIIETMVPNLSRYAFETKTDYFTVLHAKDYLNSVIYQMIQERMREAGPKKNVSLYFEDID